MTTYLIFFLLATEMTNFNSIISVRYFKAGRAWLQVQVGSPMYSDIILD